jgi:hypothetical protein
MKTEFDFKNAYYRVSNVAGFNMDEALRLWKAKYPSYEHFRRDIIKTEALKKFGEFVMEVWEDISPITPKESFEQGNAERRRVYFDCIGVQKLFEAAKPTLLDAQTIEKKRFRWDDKNDMYEYTFKDVYELYSVDPAMLYAGTDATSNSWGVASMSRNKYFAVRCWCTTTNREYWLYVPEDAALQEGFSRWWNESDKKYDAIKAIAWTIRIDISNPERIYRQGDIIVVKESKESQNISPTHLTKSQYLTLMYSES